MLKLILYEWKKLWKNASVLKILLLFWVLSGVIFQGELNQDKEAHQTYLEFHKATDNMTEKDAENWLLEQQEKGNTGYGEYKALLYLEDEISAIKDYDTYRESIQNRYQQSQNISVFAKDEKENQYMERIAKKYKELEVKAPMKRQPYQGLLKVLDFYVQYILAIVLLIYLVSVVFIQEQRNGKADFVRTMLKGKNPLFCAKACTVYGTLLIYLFGTFFIHLALAFGTYGMISMDAAIQSVPGFYAVPYAWSIGMYIIAYGAMQGLAAFLLAAIAVFLARWSVSEVKTAFGIMLVMGGSLFCQNTMTGEGFEAIFRIWNIWGAFTGKSIIRNYEILRFENILVEQSLGIPLCIIVAVFFLIIGGIHCPKEREKKYYRKEKRKRYPHGLFYYEMKKLWIYQGGIILFAACMCIQAMTVYRYKTYVGTDEFYYQKYIDEFGNRITAETDEKIAAEKMRLEHLEEELSQTEDFVKSYKFTQDLECVGGFQKYVERTENLLAENKKPILLKDKQYELLFGNTEVSQMMVILLCVSFAFLIPSVYQKEKETGMEVLQNTSRFGRGKLWRLKIETVLLYCIPFVLFSGAMVFVKEKKTYALEWMSPIGCLSQYWEKDTSIPVWIAFVVGIILQCIVTAVVVIFLSACAKRVRNQHMLTGMILGVLAVPVILSSYVPVRALNWAHHLFFVFTADLKIVVVICFILGTVVFLMTRRERKI